MSAFDVFLSYNSEDRSLVEELALRLRRSSIKPWLDCEQLAPGSFWQEEIEAALEHCPACAVCLGPHDLGRWERPELRASLSRRITSATPDCVVIPVLLPGASEEQVKKLPAFLKQATWVDLRAGVGNKAEIQKLVRGIRRTPPGPRRQTRQRQDESRNPNAEGETEALQRFEELAKMSFHYCLNRRRTPSADSSTCMYFYGLDFDVNSPRLHPVAVVQAIGTELEHLRSVEWGDAHNPEKPRGKSQIADEVIDMFRYVYILAISHDVEEWQTEWIEGFNKGFGEASGLSRMPFPHYAAALSELYESLVNMFAESRSPTYATVNAWIVSQMRALGGVCGASGVTLDDLSNDLHSRLYERKDQPGATTHHSRHSDFPTHARVGAVRIYFPDRPGTYRVLLKHLADAGFDVLVSHSKTVVWGETAEVDMLLLLGDSDTSPSETEFAHRLEYVRSSREARGQTKPFKKNRLALAVHVLWSETFRALAEGQFLKAISAAMAKHASAPRD